jgi:hypothetical protein
MAIALLPLLEGETIGSNLGRYGDFIGLDTTLALRRYLFGYACKPATRLPSGLDHLAEEARDYWDLDTDTIINGHTEFQYATLTLSEVQRLAMRSYMREQPVGRCLRRSCFGCSGERATGLRYCDDCLLDWRTNGIPAHWTVDHHLPGVYVCGVHSRVLRMTRPDFTEERTDPTVTALKRCDDEEILKGLSFLQRSAIEDVAKRGAQYRATNDSLPSAMKYREWLRDAGFVWPNGRTDSRAFIASILEYFGHEYCQQAGLDWQKMTVWLRSIADQGRDKDVSHPLMFIVAESLLNRRCGCLGSFLPAVPSTGKDDGIGCRVSHDDYVDKNIDELTCKGILHRTNDTWKERSREGAGWKLVCSCGVSYRVSGASSSGKARLTAEAYGSRYKSLICKGGVNYVCARCASRGHHVANAEFLRWARHAGFSRANGLSIAAIQRLRDQWRSLVQSAQPDKKITSAYRADPELYRTLRRHDRNWFAAFNLVNRTCRKRSLPTVDNAECEKLDFPGKVVFVGDCFRD